MAGLAVRVIGNLTERVRHPCGNPADRAKQIPVQLEQALPGAVKTRSDNLVGIEPEALGEGQRPDAGKLLGRSGDQVLEESVDNLRINAAFEEPVDQPVQPLPPRRRHAGPLLERIECRRKPAPGADLSAWRRCGDKLSRGSSACPRPRPSAIQVESPRWRRQPQGVDERGAAARSCQELDRADQPLERTPGVLPENPHSPGLDPLVREFFSDLGHAGLAPFRKGANAPAGLEPRLVGHRCKTERTVESIGVCHQRPELARG